MGNKKGKRRLNIWVTAQTAYNLQRLSEMAGRDVGFVVDKLTRDRMVQLHDLPSLGSAHRPSSLRPVDGHLPPQGEGSQRRKRYEY